MKILSLFDGISCARVALERAGIPVEAYYASEIDKYAIQVSKKNYPDIQHVGSVVGLHLPPLYVSFTDKVVSLKEIIQGSVISLPNGSEIKQIEIPAVDLLIGGSPCQDLSIAKRDRKGLDGERSGLFWEYVRILKEVKPKYFILENVASMSKEAKAIITEALGVEPIMINASLVSAQNRKRLFWTNIPNVTQPEDRGILLKDILLDGENELIKNSWKYKEGKPREYKGKCPTLSANMGTAGGHIPLTRKDKRKLIPIECERLQGLPDNYTDGISNTQRYKCLGNAFNVEVVAHILSFIPR